MSSIEKYKRYAKRVALFNGLEPEEIGEILEAGEMFDYHKGATIFYQDQLGSNIFVVWKGTVGIFIDNGLIAKCEVGDAFGEMSALNHRPHVGTASALTDAKCLVLTENNLNDILQKHAATRFLLNIIHILCGHLEKANHSAALSRRKVRAMERKMDRASASS